MNQQLGLVIENRILWSTVRMITVNVASPALAIHPGQLALVRYPATCDPYLRSMAWFYQSESDRVSLTLDDSDPLAARIRIGDTLDLLGPVGRAFEFNAQRSHVLLVGEGAGAAPLVSIARQFVDREDVVVFGSRTEPSAAGLEFPPHLLPAEIEYQRDVSPGNEEILAWADCVIASGSEDMYRELGQGIRATRYRLEPGFARVLIAPVMPCGTGVCQACGLETRQGLKLACVDGPWFDLAGLSF